MQNLICVVLSPIGFIYPITKFDAKLIERTGVTIRDQYNYSCV